MSITATVKNDTIKLPKGVHLPNGTPVRIEPLTEQPRKPFGERFAEFVGVVDDAPKDLAQNLDHYLYGTPKQAK